MGKDKDASNDIVLPRLFYSKTPSGAQITFNFSADYADGELSAQMRSVSDEWTSFCISFFRVVPKLVGVGYGVALGDMEQSVVEYLDQNNVGYEDQVDEDGCETRAYVVHEDDLSIVASKLKKTGQVGKAAQAMERSTLSSLLAEYEHSIMRIVEVVSSHSPEKFSHSVSLVEPCDLDECSSIQDLKDKIARRKVQADLRNKSIIEVLEWISTTFNISAVPDKTLYLDFVEICQRRHLLMHNGGVVNERYIDLCAKAGWKRSNLPELGTKLRVSTEYLKRATGRVYQVGSSVLHMLWQSMGRQEANDSYGALLSVSHDFLTYDLTKMAERVIEFASFSEKHFDHRLKMCFRINSALAKLFEPGREETEQTTAANAILDDFDWSVTTPEFDLALACARREFDRLMELADSAEGHVSYYDVRTLCVYREARKIDGFLEKFPRSHIQLPGPS